MLTRREEVPKKLAQSDNDVRLFSVDIRHGLLCQFAVWHIAERASRLFALACLQLFGDLKLALGISRIAHITVCLSEQMMGNRIIWIH